MYRMLNQLLRELGVPKSIRRPFLGLLPIGGGAGGTIALLQNESVQAILARLA